MYIPKIIFKYAYPFDQGRRRLYKEKQLGDYPEADDVRKKVDEYRKTWSDYNKDDKIIKRIVELLGVTYPRDIEAYIFGTGMNPMSTPLLIPTIRKRGENSGEQFIELLVHELTHIFAASREENPRIEKYWQEIREKHKDEPVLVQNHLIVYAVVEIILTEIFGKEKMIELIKVEDKDYQRSIELTDELGPEKLIEQFKRLTV
jgi:hypothetical protein